MLFVSCISIFRSFGYIDIRCFYPKLALCYSILKDSFRSSYVFIILFSLNPKSFKLVNYEFWLLICSLAFSPYYCIISLSFFSWKYKYKTIIIDSIPNTFNIKVLVSFYTLIFGANRSITAAVEKKMNEKFFIT